jgi:hypothetical protein
VTYARVFPCSDEELVKLANEWSIEGKDLISEVTCKEPYEWNELTGAEWEFSPAALLNAKNAPYHVCPYPSTPHPTPSSSRLDVPWKIGQVGFLQS